MASQGLEALGVNAFDNQGRFRGFRTIVDQLSKAQGKLTTEQFAAYSVMAFGREPLAAISALAAEGGTNFDAMRKAVTHQGGAAASRPRSHQGLGGAVEGLKSRWRPWPSTSGRRRRRPSRAGYGRSPTPS